MTPWTATRQASLSITNSRSLPKLMSIQSVIPSNHLILCRPLLLLPSIFPSIRVFSNESALRSRWPEYWFSISTQISNKFHFQLTPWLAITPENKGKQRRECLRPSAPSSAGTGSPPLPLDLDACLPSCPCGPDAALLPLVVWRHSVPSSPGPHFFNYLLFLLHHLFFPLYGILPVCS